MEGGQNSLWVRQDSVAAASEAKGGWEEVRPASGLRQLRIDLVGHILFF